MRVVVRLHGLLAAAPADLRPLGPREDFREVQVPGLVEVDGAVHAQAIGASDRLVERAETELREQLAHFARQQTQEVLDVLGLSLEALAQRGVLRGDADRAGVLVALAHHHAA